MIRVKRIKAKDYYGDVEITVRVSNTQCLTKHEVDKAVTGLADNAMRALNEAWPFKVPMSKIQVV